ncbi:MAG: carbohydrate kinase family protein [Clostridia bacterium]|nr:carbohydrate kinase family protein [Clostridia bacterium]
MRKVACVGILVADIIVSTVEKYPEKGKLENVDAITVHNGGNAMTAALNLRSLGVESAIFGKVGNDIYGNYLNDILVNKEVDVRGLSHDDSVQTSASIVILDSSGERSFFHCVGANAVFSVDDVDFSVLEEYDMVFVTGSFLLSRFDGKETMEFLKKCKEMGKTTFLDVCWDASGRWGELLDCSMPYIDYFMPSIDEAVNIAQKSEPDEIAQVFMDKGVKNVIIKLGSKGSYMRLAGQEKGTVYPCYKVENVVDTTGAGDSFCSGFLAGFARGESLEDCIKFANATGAHCVQAKGASAGIKDYDTIKSFMKEREK